MIFDFTTFSGALSKKAWNKEKMIVVDEEKLFEGNRFGIF